jgi:LmbE family N-acetylglucosaminyl deacetylase
MYEVWTPLQKMDDIIDISPYVSDKVAAIRAHKSQCDIMRFDEAALALNRFRGEMHSWPGGDYAEVFRHMNP